jgi:predicted lipoprotein with Yx(FWY)xxD motif
MLHRTTTTFAGLGVAAAIAVGVFAATGSHATSHAASSTAASGSIRTATATVNGKSQPILTDSRGMPLYYYAPDGPKQSHVSGSLAALWPADTSTATPASGGLAGSLTVVHDSHGNQVAYNGHLLYTFVSDRRDIVTGQGVKNFFVATPTLSTVNGSSSSGTSSGTSMNGRGY